MSIIGTLITLVSLMGVYHFFGIYKTSLLTEAGNTSSPTQAPINVVNGSGASASGGGITVTAKPSSTGALQPTENTPQVQNSVSQSPASLPSTLPVTAHEPTPMVTLPPGPPSTSNPPPAPSPGSGNWTRPTAVTTGYSGSLTPWTGSTTFTANNQTISNVDFGGYIKVTGSNIVLNNCHFSGMVFYGPGPLTVKNCTSDGGINSDSGYGNINGVTYDHVHVIMGAHDGIDVFSNNGHTESNITLVDTLIDGMNFPSSSTSHGDGLQVRGVNGLTVQRVVINDGPYQSQDNSAIYFENVNGGDSNMHLTDLDLYGGGYTFYTNAVSASTAVNVAIRASGHWGVYHSNATPSGWGFTNVTGPSGQQINP